MYIFTRSATLKPEHLMDGPAFAVEVAARAKAVTGKEVAAFMTVFGQPSGTLLWSAATDSHAELADVTAKLMVDPGYLDDLRTHAHLWLGPSNDRLFKIVASSGADPKPIYATVTAVIANGKLAEAMAFGVRAQQYVASKLGLATAFVANTYGPYGGVLWTVGATTMDDIDRYSDFQASDAEFQAMLNEAGSLFLPQSGSNGLIQRIN